MARFALNLAVVVCSSILLVGCFPLWETLKVESISIGPDGTLTGRETGWNTQSPRDYKTTLKPGAMVRASLGPSASVCGNADATGCYIEGTLVRLELSSDGRAVSALVFTIQRLRVYIPARKNPVEARVPAEEVRVALADILAFYHTQVGACGFWTCVGF